MRPVPCEDGVRMARYGMAVSAELRDEAGEAPGLETELQGEVEEKLEFGVLVCSWTMVIVS